MAKIIAICGKICCGKTYYANQIKEKEKAVILSCDELTKDLFDNDLGEKHDEMALRIWSYFKKKSVELVNIGCTVILDWGFWSIENRRSLTEFCRSQNVHCEWHYIDVDDQTWNKNIEERNYLYDYFNHRCNTFRQNCLCSEINGETSYILYFSGPYQDGIDKKWLYKDVCGFD